MKLGPSLAASFVVLAGLASANVARGATTAVYNPATGLVTVSGIAVTETVSTPAPAGTFTFNTGVPLYGTVTLNLQCAANLSIKIGDAILGELPAGWTLSSGSYVVEGTTTTGTISETPQTAGSPTVTTDPGFVATLGEATTDFSSETDLVTTVQYAVPSSPSPVGVALKGVLVARASYTCNGSPVVTIGTLSTQPAPNFPAVTSTADPTNVTIVTALPAAPALPPWGPWLLAASLAGVGFVVRRRVTNAT